jgi:twitching motility protein PilT
MARLDSFLRLAVDQRASDVHLRAGAVPTIRHHGTLQQLPFRPISELEARTLIKEILTPEQVRALDDQEEIDFVYSLEGVARFRVNAFHQSLGVGAAFRVVPSAVPSLEELGLPPVVKRLTEYQNGLVLVCGPTGSGKTSTLAAMINEINSRSNRHRHIITVEDPVEFVHTPVNAVINQRQIGKHTKTFAAALRSALREAPDVVVVGEMRDLETISLAISAAETGVLVFGTLHTNSAAKAVDRIIDAYAVESREQIRGVLSVILRGSISQVLCKRLNGESRIAVIEVLVQNIAVSNMIRENKIHHLEALIQTSENDGSGMQSLDGCVFRYIKQGLISLDEGLKVASDPERIRQLALELSEDA